MKTGFKGRRLGGFEMEMKNQNGIWEEVEVYHRDGYNEYFWKSGTITREYPEDD